MFNQYATQLFLLAVFFVIVYAVMEVIKNFIISFPDNWGSVFKVGLPKKINRWISFGLAYLFAWAFDFQFATIVFQTINGSRASLPQHANYFVVACLLFCGAKWIYHQINLHHQILTGKANETDHH